MCLTSPERHCCVDSHGEMAAVRREVSPGLPLALSLRPPTPFRAVCVLDQVCLRAGLTGARLDRRRDDVAHGAAIVAREPAHL